MTLRQSRKSSLARAHALSWRWVWTMLLALAMACAAPEATAPLEDQLGSDRDSDMTDVTIDDDVTFSHQGEGVRGGGQTLVVSPDRTAVLTTGQGRTLEPVTFDVPEELWVALMAALEDADLAAQPEFPQPHPTDEFLPAVLYRFDDGTTSVTVADVDAPSELVALARVFQDIIAAAPDHPRRG